MSALPATIYEECNEIVMVPWPTHVTFEQSMRSYICEHVLCKPKTERKLRLDAKRVASTARELFITLDPQTPVEALTRNHGRVHYQARSAQGVGAATVRRELAIATAAILHAKREGRVREVASLWKPESSPPRVMFLTREQHAQLMRLPMSRRMRLFWMLAFGTGARSEAIEEATWERLNWTDRTIDYRVPGVVYKNKRRVVAPLNSKLFERLQNYYNIRDPADPYIIGRGNPRKNKTSTTYHQAAACMEAIGITQEGAARHIARHTFATWLLQARVPLNRVAHLLGDKASMVETVYGHLAPSDLFDDTEKILEQLAA